MRRITKHRFGFDDVGVQLTSAERAALRRAAKIAKEVRDRCRSIAGVVEWEDTDTDTMLAHVEHDAADLAAEGFIVARSDAAQWAQDLS